VLLLSTARVCEESLSGNCNPLRLPNCACSLYSQLRAQQLYSIAFSCQSNYFLFPETFLTVRGYRFSNFAKKVGVNRKRLL
jgi:hypothetical protein